MLSFAVASLSAVVSGCLVVRSSGFGPGVWTRNAIAWLIGALLCWIVLRMRPAKIFQAILLSTPVALLISLFGTGQEGVHRWITLGPLNWNVAFLMLPAATVAFSATASHGPRWSWWSVLIVQAELCLQPDASQATAFAASILITLFLTRCPVRTRLATSLFVVLAAVIAWIRPDPLAPVPAVEGVIALAAVRSGILAAICVLSLGAVAITPFLVRTGGGANASKFALSVYFLACSVMPLFGAFPVPLVGMGMSPIVGFWLGVGALVATNASASSYEN